MLHFEKSNFESNNDRFDYAVQANVEVVEEKRYNFLFQTPRAIFKEQFPIDMQSFCCDFKFSKPGFSCKVK